MLLAWLLLAAAQHASAFLPAQNPPWGPRWLMNESTLSMACNQSGPLNVSVYGSFAHTSIDWSSRKAQWAAAKPMTCEEELAAQARALRAHAPSTTPWLYFNLVKALPWYESVRALLSDPAHAGWFIRFAPGVTTHVPRCDPVTGACSPFYHDQSQTPAVPTPAQPHPDGACVGACDCGAATPCGEYLWDHRNESLRQWLVDYVAGPHMLGLTPKGSVSGLFLDDFWCSSQLNGSHACSDPVQGPTEIDAHSQVDMGLSDADIADITRGWLATMTAVQEAVLAAGGFTWSLMPGQENANASPLLLTRANCAATLRAACAHDALWQRAPLLMGITPGGDLSLPNFREELAAFLLMRGSNAFIGWGEWGMTWNPSVPIPAELLSGDYGQPVGECAEDASSAVFTRTWTKARVSLSCANFSATIEGR